MNQPNSTQELRRLIDAFCDGSLSAQDAVRLDGQLAVDGEARKIYLQQLWVEAELYALCMPLGLDSPGDSCETRVLAPSAQLGVDADGTADDVSTDNVATDNVAAGSVASDHIATVNVASKFRIHRSNWSFRPWLTLAASIFIASVGSGWLVYQGATGHGPLAILRTSNTPQSALENSHKGNKYSGERVARITGTRDCRWGEPGGDVGFGASLYAGQELNLRAGLAEVTFENGVQILLEGPSRFVVPVEDGAKLIAGKIAAAIPLAAAGFTVRTARLAISNPGTQFGLVVNHDGGTEVHVFEGSIRARALDSSSHELNSVELSANEAVRLSPRTSSFTLVQSGDERFVRTLTPSTGPSHGLFALDEFAYPVGPIAWQNGGFGWAGPWADLDFEETADWTATNGIAEGSLAGSALVARGNRAIQTGRWNRVRRVLSTSLRGVFDAAGLVEDQDGMRLIGRDGTSIYISFLQRVSEVDDVFYGFELYRGDGNSNRVLSIGNGAEATGYGVSSNFNGVYEGNVCTPLYEPFGEEDTGAHLFVIRIDYGAENDDVVTVYRDPTSLLDERQCEEKVTLRGNLAFDRISLGNFESMKQKTHEVDEIRVGTSFTAVTGRQSSVDRQFAEGDFSSREIFVKTGANLSTNRLSMVNMECGVVGLLLRTGRLETGM